MQDGCTYRCYEKIALYHEHNDKSYASSSDAIPNALVHAELRETTATRRAEQAEIKLINL